MGERDAFGNPVGQDPLAEQGWRAPAAAVPEVVRPSPLRHRRRRDGRSRLAGVVVAAGLAGLVAAGGGVGVKTPAQVDLPAARPVPEAAAGADPLTAAGFAEIVAALRRQAGTTRVTLVQVTGTQVVVQTEGRTLRWAEDQIVAFGERRPSDTPSFAWDAVVPAAPRRLSLRVPGFDDAVLLRAPDLRWVATGAGGASSWSPDGRRELAP
jgi:hypothetical protein